MGSARLPLQASLKLFRADPCAPSTTVRYRGARSWTSGYRPPAQLNPHVPYAERDVLLRAVHLPFLLPLCQGCPRGGLSQGPRSAVVCAPRGWRGARRGDRRQPPFLRHRRCAPLCLQGAASRLPSAPPGEEARLPPPRPAARPPQAKRARAPRAAHGCPAAAQRARRARGAAKGSPPSPICLSNGSNSQPRRPVPPAAAETVASPSRPGARPAANAEASRRAQHMEERLQTKMSMAPIAMSEIRVLQQVLQDTRPGGPVSGGPESGGSKNGSAILGAGAEHHRQPSPPPPPQEQKKREQQQQQQSQPEARPEARQEQQEQLQVPPQQEQQQPQQQRAPADGAGRGVPEGAVEAASGCGSSGARRATAAGRTPGSWWRRSSAAARRSAPAP